MKAKLEEKAVEVQREQELSGQRDTYQYMQPIPAPHLEVGMRLDILCNYHDDELESDTLIWCQGKVTEVADGTNLRKNESNTEFYRQGVAALIQWDADETRGEESSISIAYLPKNKWNKHVEGSWRLDIAPNHFIN